MSLSAFEMRRIFSNYFSYPGRKVQHFAQLPYRLDIYELLNRTSSRIVRVAAASGLAREFWILLPPNVRIKNSTSSVYSSLKHLLTIFQDSANQGARGVRKYVGPVTVAVQELDGWFSYTMAVETVHSKHDITCHSKSRRNKKKKIPLCTNEEVDMDLSAME